MFFKSLRRYEYCNYNSLKTAMVTNGLYYIYANSVSNATVLIFVNEPIPDKHQQLAEASNIQCKLSPPFFMF